MRRTKIRHFGAMTETQAENDSMTTDLPKDLSIDNTSEVAEPVFTPQQARVIAVLVEKSITTPKYYPMTVNAITQGCNQKTSRNPVMAMTEGEVGSALLQLAEKRFVTRDDSSARATKWSQRLKQQLDIDLHSRAILVASILRGPQTRAELRIHAEPLSGPDTPEALEDALLQLLTREDPLLMEFERQPGQKEARMMHTACGKTEAPVAEAAKPTANTGQFAALEERVAALEAKVAALLAQ